MKTYKRLKPNIYNITQKKRLANQLQNISKEDAIQDFERLKQIHCNAQKKGLSRIGNKVVDYFTLTERLNTRGNKGISFYDLLYNKSRISKLRYIQNMLSYYKKKDIKTWKKIMDIYFGSINIFRPLIAMDIYCRFKPQCVLDITMGWGGRMIAACALNIPKYIGIDINTELIQPYKKMQHFMAQLSTTKTELYFQDAVTFPYHNIIYDLVLSSLPYYNIEIYNGVSVKTKEQWDEDFYLPLINNSWNGLSKKGYYCLNIPTEIYDRTAYKVLGEPYQKILLQKSKRNKYHEYIYVWMK
jgi:hypothetical protein